MEIWWNYGSLFWKREGEFVLLPQVEIEGILWKNEASDGQHLGSAAVTLEGMLPASSILFEIGDGVEIHLCQGKCGTARQYRESDVVLKFTDCKIASKFSPDVTAISSQCRSVVTLVMAMTCEVERVI